MSRTPQQDAHVKARRRIARRVINREMDWTPSRLSSMPRDPEARLAWAYVGVDAYQWSEGWGMRQTGSYHPIGGYDGPKVPYKDVPTFVIHNMMCIAARAGRVARGREFGMDRTPREIWEGLTAAKRSALVGGAEMAEKGYAWIDSRNRTDLILAGLARGNGINAGLTLTPLGRAVAEYGRGQQ